MSLWQRLISHVRSNDFNASNCICWNKNIWDRRAQLIEFFWFDRGACGAASTLSRIFDQNWFFVCRRNQEWTSVFGFQTALQLFTEKRGLIKKNIGRFNRFYKTVLCKKLQRLNIWNILKKGKLIYKFYKNALFSAF